MKTVAKVSGLLILVALLFLVLFNPACKKEEKEETPPPAPQTETPTKQDTIDAIQTAQQSAELEEMVYQAIGLGMSQITSEASKGDCPKIERIGGPLDFNKVVVTFGTSYPDAPCIIDSVKLYGQIQIYSNVAILKLKAGSVLSIDLIDFIIDTIKINGTGTLTVIEVKYAQTKDSEGKTVMYVQYVKGTINFDNIKITHIPKNVTAVLDLMGVYKWHSSDTKDDVNDDIMTFYRPADFSGTDLKGRGFKGSVEQDVIFKMECTQPVQGLLKITYSKVNGKITIPVYVDFGKGNCDDSLYIWVGNRDRIKPDTVITW